MDWVPPNLSLSEKEFMGLILSNVKSQSRHQARMGDGHVPPRTFAPCAKMDVRTFAP